jgi:DNA helicase-2/ATP-dependent DNA helicase PcrA
MPNSYSDVGFNPEQEKAILHNEGPLLILAGAGSGKTRVLTYRIAHLITDCDVNPYNIMAITFTNKAAKEMRERIDKIVGDGSEYIWVSTFHSTCVRILRKFISTIGYNSDFTIYYTADQKSLISDIIKILGIDPKRYKERDFMNVISHCKDELITPEEYAKSVQKDFSKQNHAKVYAEYQRRLKGNNALDFDDLLMKTVELLTANTDALNYYRMRFHYILVDEYQDTNTAQFMLIKLLAEYTAPDGKKLHNLCVVGDDDQSIYKFRGANIGNILNFEKYYPEAEVIKLEQNYRSSGNILNLANEVISKNTARKEKKLWTDKNGGSDVRLINYSSGYDEAYGIINEIYESTSKEKSSYSDYAILYRTNAQSRLFEEALVKKNIPYKLVGSVNFYQRKEIKDILAYLRTINNASDDIALKRVINIPKRGIGLTTLDYLDEYATAHGLSLFDSLKRLNMIDTIKEKGKEKLRSFYNLINNFHRRFEEAAKNEIPEKGSSIFDITNELLDTIDYRDFIITGLEDDEADDKLANIDELMSKIKDYENSRDTSVSLGEFLADIALMSDLDELEENNEKVTLMTVHSAKGLEFNDVYLAGMDDGLFPSYMSINSGSYDDIEEERRLCYVGITRAKQNLTLTHANTRMIRGDFQGYPLSRFISDVPRYLLKMVA